MAKSANAGCGPQVGRVGGCLTILVGIGCTVLGVGWINEAKASLGWPTAPGRVTRVELTEDRHTDAGTYRLTLEYAYAVDGTPYVGTRYAAGDPSELPEVLRPLADALRARPDVPVYYDPADPSHSLLKPGVASGANAFILCLGVLPVGCGLWLVWISSAR